MPDLQVMFPSESTAINEKRKIFTQADLDEFFTEIKGLNLYEAILTKHNDVRTPFNDAIINSKISIVSILNLYCSIFLISHQLSQ